MASKFAGLFGGASPGDIRSLMEQENQGRVRQAFIDQTKAGGGPLAANAARYREQGLQGLDRMLGAGAGLTDMGLPQDPRMVKANKREADKTEILGILNGYYTDDGVIDEQEVQQGWSLLMSKGYQDEAKEFRLRAEGMMKKQIAKDKVDSANGFKSTGSTIYQTRGNKKYAVTPGVKDGKPIMLEAKLKDGELLGKRFRDISEYEKIASVEQGAKEKQKRKTIKYKEDLERTTLEIKKNLNVEETTAINFAKKDLNTSEEFMRAGAMARNEKEKAIELLKLSQNIGTTGGLQAGIMHLKNKFGLDTSDEATFRTGVQMLLVQNLKKIMGARPTDKDLEELAKAMANVAQTNEANEAILKRFVSQMDKEVSYGMWFVDNPTGKFTDFYREQMQPPPQAHHLKFLKDNRNKPSVKKQFQQKFGKKALKKALENNDGE